MSDNKNFENLINKDKYQVFIMYCPAYFPFNFFRHPWIVINKKGDISRWEIRNFINRENKTYFFINNQKPFEGINKTIFIKNKWRSNLLKLVESDIAMRMIYFIENTKKSYPYCNNYYFDGPNSNTYLQWILNNFPELKIKLSWRFIGKNYKI